MSDWKTAKRLAIWRVAWHGMACCELDAGIKKRNVLKVPRADCFLDVSSFQVLHEFLQTGLRLLSGHGAPLDGLDGGVCFAAFG